MVEDSNISSSYKLKSLQPHDIDAFWLQRKLSKIYDDPTQAQKKVKELLEILDESNDERDVENKLVLLLGFNEFDFIKLLRSNRQMILYCTLLASAQNLEDKNKIEIKMKEDPKLASILHSLEQAAVTSDFIQEEKQRQITLRNSKIESKLATNIDENKEPLSDDKRSNEKYNFGEKWNPQQIINLEDIQFPLGGHFMANKKCQLPEGSFRKQKKGFEEVHVPASKPYAEDSDSRVSIDSLPKYVQPAFEGFKTLNVIQTAVHKAALETDENLLICAPTVYKYYIIY